MPLQVQEVKLMKLTYYIPNDTNHSSQQACTRISDDYVHPTI